MDVYDLYRDKPTQPNKILRMSLPLPPSINHMYFNTKNGGKRLTGRAEDYVRRSKALINEAIQDQCWHMRSKSTWYYIDLVFFMPDRRTRDSHNMLKLLLDVMQGSVFNNDYYVMPNIKAVEYDPDHPRIEIIVKVQTTSEREKALKLMEG